jgi:hypothetical protein
MAPNDTLRAGALLLNAISDLAIDVEEQFRDGGRDDMQKRAQALQAHVAQLQQTVAEELALQSEREGK